jgi:hypothetical protein
VVPEALQAEDLAFAHHKEVRHLEVRVRAGACATSDVDAALDALLASNKSATKSAARSEVETSEAAHTGS